ncbi:MAG: hypothetical protein KDD63_08585, partial [Bacteroidetes bacterium]|nr:hypothetical protein [Bacteroidota bacterium]
ALLCILLGGMVLKNGTLSADEKKDFDALKKNDKIAAEMAERLEKLNPKIVDLFNDQHILHDSLHPSAQGKDLTKQGYLDALNNIAIEAAKLSDSLRNYQSYYEKNMSPTDGKDLDIVFLQILETLVSQADIAYVKLNESGGTFTMGGKSIIGIAAIVPEVAGAGEVNQSVSPEVQAKNDKIAELEGQIQAFMNDQKNEAVAKAVEEKNKAVNEAGTQKKLKVAQMHLSSAQGMLTVTQSFIESISSQKDKSWFKNNLKPSYQTIVSTYSGSIDKSLTDAEASLSGIENAEAISMRSEVSRLRGEKNKLSSMLN